MTPQVVTETLYALAMASPPWIATEVRIVSTRTGSEQALLSLSSLHDGQIDRLFADLGAPPPHFDEGHIHLVAGKDGCPLDDLRTPEDNERAADTITEVIRGLAADPSCAMHVSIAGGRKTMGFYLGSALSLFGREQDMLSHVLVDEPFESSWEFFYPTKTSHIVKTRDGRVADATKATVMLAPIPFVRLRHGLDQRIMKGSISFSASVQSVEAELSEKTVLIQVRDSHLAVGGTRVSMARAELAFYLWFAKMKKNSSEPIAAPRLGVPEMGYAREFLACYCALAGVMGDTERTEKALSGGMDKGYFEQRKSRVNAALRDALGPSGDECCGIVRVGQRPHWRFCLRLSAEWISVV